MILDPLLREPSVVYLDSTIGMHPQSAPAEYMGNLTENNLFIRAIIGSAVTHVDVISRSLVTRPSLTSDNHGASHQQFFINANVV